MMNNPELSIKLKLVTGYILLVTLFVVVLSLIYCEHDNMEAISVQAKELSEQRRQTEQITIQLLDLSFQSEQMVGVREDDFEIYKCKRDSVVSSLEILRLRLNNPAQCARIDSVLFLLQAEEEHLFAILNDVRELRESYDLVEKRIPDIIRQTNHQSEDLSERLQENIEKGRKQTSGIKGLFRSKKKSREQIEQENETILRNAQKRQSGTLRVLADEIAGTHKANTLRLISHVDSLTVRNTYLNKQIRRLITEFGIADRDIRENVIAKELFGRKQAIMTISVFSIVALLLAIVFYILLHLDIQERYRNRIRLERSNNRNEELLAARKNMMLTVSHDLRAPLAAINGYAELLPDERRKENRLRYTEAILQSSGRMLSLLDTLPDGKGELQGDDNYRSGRYIGLYGQDFDAIIDLQEMKEISSVSLGTYLVPGDYIFGLTGLEIYGSNDGSAYSKIASKTIPVLEKGSKNNVLKRDTVSFGKTKARYVRIIGKNIPVLPKWHPGAGKRTYLFLDEITID